MEFLTNLFGNLTSGVIRLAVTVGILAAVYFFIVKPILRTTENTVESTNKQIENSFNRASAERKGIETRVNKTVEGVNRQVQAEVERSFRAAKIPGQPEKLLNCIQRANEDVHRIERCSRRY